MKNILKKNEFLKKTILLFLIILIYYLVLYLLQISCPIKEILKIPCPGCGVTRAILSLFKLDLKGYMFYHPAGIIIIGSFLLYVYKDEIIRFINLKIYYFIIFLNLVIILIVYIIRIITRDIYLIY